MEIQTFDDLTESYNGALKALGVNCSEWLEKVTRASVLVKRHYVVGKQHLDDSIVCDYVNELGDRLDAGEICKDHTNSMG